MAAILRSVSSFFQRGEQAAAQIERSQQARIYVIEYSKKQASNYRASCIHAIAIGVIASLGLLLVSPTVAVIAAGVAVASAYFNDSFARYFDHLTEIFRDQKNFAPLPMQTIDDRIDYLFNEKATEELPFFVKALIQNPSTSHWFLD